MHRRIVTKPTSTVDPSFLRRLDRFRLVARRSVSNRPGSTPVPHATQDAGIEVARYRSYSIGSDLRHVDWNVYARLDELLVRQFQAEREAPLHLVIDASASMGSPEGDGKLTFAIAVATCLAYISLRRCDPVRIVVAGSGRTSTDCSRVVRHLRRFEELTGFLGSLCAAGAGTLDAAIDAHLRSARAPGMAVVLSDFLIPAPLYQKALADLIAARCSVAALRLLGPREREPSYLPAHLRLHDVETGRERILHLTATHRAAYAAALQQHLDELATWCAARSIPCAVVDPTGGLERCLFRDLPAAGLLA